LTFCFAAGRYAVSGKKLQVTVRFFSGASGERIHKIRKALKFMAVPFVDLLRSLDCIFSFYESDRSV
jgi:hypothetical protein